jgi:hypothetical protein
MKKFYINDNTIGRYVYFNSVDELVTYLEGLVKRATGLTRAQYMQNLIDLGYGYDDSQGVIFTRSIAEQFEMGAINKDGGRIKCDVHEAISFLKEEYGS